MQVYAPEEEEDATSGDGEAEEVRQAGRRLTASRFAEHPCGGAAQPAQGQYRMKMANLGWPGSVEEPRSPSTSSGQAPRRGLQRVVRPPELKVQAGSDGLPSGEPSSCRTGTRHQSGPEAGVPLMGRAQRQESRRSRATLGAREYSHRREPNQARSQRRRCTWGFVRICMARPPEVRAGMSRLGTSWSS